METLDLPRIPSEVLPFAVVAALLLGHWLLSTLLLRVLRRAGAQVLEGVVAATRRPLYVALLPLGVLVTLPALRLEQAPDAIASRVLGSLLVLALGWTLIRMATAAFDALLERPAAEASGSLEARRRVTLLNLLRRLAIVAIAVVTVGLVLVAIPTVRNVGLSLFASAGVAGIVIGIAAQPTIANLIAGIQIAVTQPIRIGDQVIVENEFGQIREIRSSYVVIALWDQRELILPLSYFLQKPFQNWTHDSPQLLQPIMVYLDYTVPVEEIRGRLAEIIESNPLWDGRFWNLQVTDLKEHTVELRILVSCANAGAGWDLRCQVRESLLACLNQRHPLVLPRSRIVLAGRADGAPAAGEARQNG